MISRNFWLVICFGWAAFWFLAGALTFFPFLWLLSLGSVACAAIPIGRNGARQIGERQQHQPPAFPSSIYDPRFRDRDRDQQ